MIVKLYVVNLGLPEKIWYLYEEIKGMRYFRHKGSFKDIFDYIAMIEFYEDIFHQEMISG